MLPWLTSPPAQPRDEGTFSGKAAIHNALPEAHATIARRSNAALIWLDTPPAAPPRKEAQER
jgi:hypothetical protein